MLFGPDYLIKKKETETLNEANIMSYNGKGASFSVDVVPETNRGHGGKDAYFKYTPDATSYGKGSKEIRISFREPSYIKHPTGKPHQDLTVKELKTLKDQFGKPSKKQTGMTNWEYAIHRFNMSNNTDHLENKDQTSAEVRKAIKSGDYIPLDYPMPDYTKLK